MKLQNVKLLMHKDKVLMSRSRNAPRSSTMSSKTKDFIQRLCYRKPASVDMTRYGFVTDTKTHPVQLLIKPLKAQLEKIMGKPAEKIIIPRRRSPSRQTGLFSSSSRRSVGQYSSRLRSLTSGTSRKQTSIQASPDYIIRTKKRWGY